MACTRIPQSLWQEYLVPSLQLWMFAKPTVFLQDLGRHCATLAAMCPTIKKFGAGDFDGEYVEDFYRDTNRELEGQMYSALRYAGVVVH